jgi:hypothetical protein
MGRVLTNNTSLIYAIEETLGVLPGSPTWYLQEPNSINTFGAEVTTITRSPISKNRQRRKGSTVDLDSSVEYEADVTMSAFQDFVEGFMFATAVNADLDIPVTSVDTTLDDYTVAVLTAAQADKLEFSAAEYATLIFARGFTNSANNGLKVLDTDVTSAATLVPVSEDLVTEPSPPANARIELAGLRSLASAADLTWDWTAGSPGTAQLISAADITDFTQFGLTAGQFVHIGSPDGSGGVTNAFENSAANDMFGYARIVSFGTGTITFDKVAAALQFDDAAAPTTAVDIMFGKFVRNVPVDDSEFLERSFQFEMEFPNLGASVDMYQYAIGNLANSLAFSLPLTDKAGVTFGFIGTDTENPVLVASRKTNAADALDPLQTGSFNTTSDILRLRVTEVDETGLSTDFKSATITINNNVTGEKVIGQLGAKFMNFGNFEVNIEAQLLFTEAAVVNRIRDNTTVTMDFGLRSDDDGGMYFDIPSMNLGGGGREFPVNESVLINLTGETFQDLTLGTSLSVSLFPFIP